MLIPFFFILREGGLKPSITELLTLLEAMKKGVAGQSVEDFYYLSRACLVKDESKLDRFDRIFAAYFNGLEDSLADLMEDIPEDWLRKQAELLLSDEERANIEALGGFEALMKALRPKGVMVIIEAEHLCMAMRGIKKTGSIAQTSVVRGIFRKNPATRAEAMALIKGR